jgi:hypothetical protein
MKNDDVRWFHQHFPSKFARDRADEAIDQLDPSEPMTTFLDVWLVAYKKAGGKTDVVP